ncbi:hypothetical protein BH93_09510 [Rhodococcoides fascians A25f]|uniref:hypothetical protein n=1 Tax=Rhodococcoides fascians TaxID=1828 RepID=UPI000561E024|nr:hypothetical protein [Rhodococcus fascians]QII05580.1 hypothetical protein BH93_09510 [Rhodococcus fascians A25f]
MKPGARMAPEKIGSIIGAVFGLVFVFVNSDTFPTTLTVGVRVVAVVALVVVLLAVWRVQPAPAPEDGARGGFGRGYWVVVAVEVVAIFGGLAIINGPLDAPQAAVAWISTVVGVHFVALALVWKLRFFTGLGVALTALGVLALILAAAGAADSSIDAIGAILPGFLLLGFALWGSSRALVGSTHR